MALARGEGALVVPARCRLAQNGGLSLAVDPADHQPTVIVVDDSDEIRDVLTLMLESEGYRVLPVEDGETALLMTKRVQPALITLDIRLPREDGGEVLRQLKADPHTAAIPVIVITGQSDLKDSVLRDGADGVLMKPFDLEEMQDLVHLLASQVR